MNIIISNSGEMPIYEQITSQIKNMIISGDLVNGDILPSMRTLAKDLRISVITTKRAYNDLEAEGFIETVVGKGSFVAAKDPQIFREGNLRMVEAKIGQAIDIAAKSNISLAELHEILDTLYEGE